MSSGELTLNYDVHNWNRISWLTGREWVVFIFIIRLDSVTWWKGIGKRIYFLQCRLIVNTPSLTGLTMIQTSRSTTKFRAGKIKARILTRSAKVSGTGFTGSCCILICREHRSSDVMFTSKFVGRFAATLRTFTSAAIRRHENPLVRSAAPMSTCLILRTSRVSLFVRLLHPRCLDALGQSRNDVSRM
jgi:hypothetical protein